MPGSSKRPAASSARHDNDREEPGSRSVSGVSRLTASTLVGDEAPRTSAISGHSSDGMRRERSVTVLGSSSRVATGSLVHEPYLSRSVGRMCGSRALTKICRGTGLRPAATDGTGAGRLPRLAVANREISWRKRDGAAKTIDVATASATARGESTPAVLSVAARIDHTSDRRSNASSSPSAPS